MSGGGYLKIGVTANSKILNDDDIKYFADYVETEVNLLEEMIVPQSVIIKE